MFTLKPLNKFTGVMILTTVMTACSSTTPTYTVKQAEYSSWANNGDEKFHYVRKKTILLNTETGETWHLQYKKSNNTVDGYDWEPLTPVNKLKAKQE